MFGRGKELYPYRPERDRFNSFSEKLEKVRAQTEAYIKQGFNIEPGIRDSIAVFRAAGFNTSQSCEGHTDRASRIPFLMIDTLRDVDAKMPWKYVGELDHAAVAARKHALSIEEVRVGPGTGRFSPAKEDRIDRASLEVMAALGDEPTPLPKFRQALGRHQKVIDRLEILLQKFYEGREVPSEVHLEVSVGNGYAMLESNSPIAEKAAAGRELTPEENERLTALLPAARKELQEFTDFVKQECLRKERVGDR